MRRSGELLAVQIRGDTEVYAKGPDSQSSPPTCDGTPPQNLQDLWATTSSPVHYLNITGAAFEVHLPVTEGCREIWSIIPYVWEESAGGGTTVYGRERWSGDHFQFDLRRDDAWLVRNNSWTYERAEAPDLPACPPGRGGRAAEIDCAALPELPVGGEVNGHLDENDSFARDRHFDLYRVCDALRSRAGWAPKQASNQRRNP